MCKFVLVQSRQVDVLKMTLLFESGDLDLCILLFNCSKSRQSACDYNSQCCPDVSRAPLQVLTHCNKSEKEQSVCPMWTLPKQLFLVHT